MKRFILFFILSFISFHGVMAQITMEHEADGIVIFDKGRKVFKYQVEPKDYEGKYSRNNYIHPLWGVDGAEMTDDFPADHLHHRGIFWAWHQLWIGDKRVGDPWEIKNFEQQIVDLEFISRHDKSGVLKSEINWSSDKWVKGGEQLPYLKENTTITIFPQRRNYRRIDFKISLLALEDRLYIGGSEDVKGYSGFSVRMKLPEDIKFIGPNGDVQPKNTVVESPGYVNAVGSMGANGQEAGIVIVDNPHNPGYPQPWILRSRRSLQNPAFPGNVKYLISTTDPLILEYSLLIYTGKMSQKKIKKAMK